jgi:hypothetical protein
MAKGLLVVQTRPAAPDRADEYHDWYDNVHIPALLEVPGVVGAHRYEACDPATGEPVADAPFLAVYELDAEDLAGPVRDLAVRTRGTPAAATDAVSVDPPPVVTLYRLRPAGGDAGGAG